MKTVQNKKALHDYFIDETFEAGIALEGWEIKAVRAGQALIGQAHCIIRNEEVFIVGMQITPLSTASTHVHAEPLRTRKLLLHKAQINKLIGKTQTAGKTLVVLNAHFSKGKLKLDIALATGKKNFDKRQSLKENEAKREAARSMKTSARNR